jgi:hypothetical protein
MSYLIVRRKNFALQSVSQSLGMMPDFFQTLALDVWRFNLTFPFG